MALKLRSLESINTNIKPQLDHCLIKGKESRILNLGCGNSNLQDELY